MNKNIVYLLKSETFLTILTGVIVFVISQYFLELVINPHREYKRLKQKIIYNIKLYCQYYNNPYNLVNEKHNVRDIEEYKSASKEVRKIGAELASYIGTVWKIRFLKRKKLNSVVDSLISISNGFYIYPNYNPIKDNKEYENIIKKTLKFK